MERLLALRYFGAQVSAPPRPAFHAPGTAESRGHGGAFAAFGRLRATLRREGSHFCPRSPRS